MHLRIRTISSGNKGVWVFLLRSCILVCFVSLLVLLHGCIENKATEQKSSSGTFADKRLELEFESEVSSSLFRVWGRFDLDSNLSEPYLLLEAALMKDSREVLRAKYLMIDVPPGQNTFEFSKVARLYPGRGYICRLEVSDSCGVIFSEERASKFSESAIEQSIYPSSISIGESIGVSEKSKGSEEEKGTRSENKDSNESSIDEEDSSNATNAGKASQNEQEVRYIGSTTSKKYHLPECRYAKKIKPEHMISFSSREEAESRGYEPCKVCNP